MESTIIDWWNSPFDLTVLLIVLAAWFALWHLLLKNILSKQEVTSLWYQLYELGSLACFGIVIFLGIMGSMIAAAMQIVLSLL